MTWVAKNDRRGTCLVASYIGIGDFLGPSYLSCCTSFLMGFERSYIGCRLITFWIGSTSGVALEGSTPCDMIIARHGTQTLQLSEDISASKLSTMQCVRLSPPGSQTRLHRSFMPHVQLLCM